MSSGNMYDDIGSHHSVHQISYKNNRITEDLQYSLEHQQFSFHQLILYSTCMNAVPYHCQKVCRDWDINYLSEVILSSRQKLTQCRPIRCWTFWIWGSPLFSRQFQEHVEHSHSHQHYSHSYSHDLWDFFIPFPWEIPILIGNPIAHL